ncbi:MAG: 4Fe-4S double cluster binding domain-containing protein [Anaerolineae bacterium]
MNATLDGLERLLGAPGIDLYGYADVRGVFGGAWGAWPRAISVAQVLPSEHLAGVRQGPTSGYYQAYTEANTNLNAIAREIESFLRAAGCEARAFPATVAAGELEQDLGEALCAPIQHKTVATRAGLGWIGRSALLVTNRYGPRVRLASIFTDMDLNTAIPVETSRCGTCRRCVEACPAEALTGAEWQVGVPRHALVDAQACRRTAERLLAERVGARNAVCGICIAVCPFAGLDRMQE